MDLTPTPAFNEAVRQVLGITDLIPGPQITLPALQDDATAGKIRARHALIIDSPAGRVADEMAAEMKRKLDGGLTPNALGYGSISAGDLVHSEWKSWFDKEDDAGNGPIEVVSCRHITTSRRLGATL